MLEMKMSVDLASPADKVWDVTGDFNGLPNWHPWVESSALEPTAGGVGRRVVNVGGTAGRRELTERLASFDAASRQYSYTIIAGPAPFVDYVGRFQVVPNGAHQCTFHFACQFRAAPGKTDSEASERIRTFYEAGLSNLTRMFGVVGTGRVQNGL
jgi:hypothetical protein